MSPIETRWGTVALVAATVTIAGAARAEASAEATVRDPTSSASASSTSDERPQKPPLPLAIDLLGSAGADTRWSRDAVTPSLGEDVVHALFIASLRASGGTLGDVRWALDVRMSFDARAKRADGGARLERATQLYDALPAAAWIELPLGERARLRLGEQVVAWSRLDLLPASDVLSRLDLRRPVLADPALARLPTPTVRLDGALSSALDVTAAWSVVSTPHRFDLFGTSWALVGPGVLGLAGATRATLDRLAHSLDSATFLRVQSALAETDTTAPSFSSGSFGDVAARARLHTGGVDIAFTYGWSASKLPQLDVDPALQAVGSRGDLDSALKLVAALDAGHRLITARYPRSHQFALDFEGNAGPFTLSWELGVSPSRPLYVLDETSSPRQADRPIVQAGARVQYVRSDDVVVTAEVDALEAISTSEQQAAEHAHPLLMIGAHRTLLAAMATVRVVPWSRHAFDLAVVATSSGPSLAVVPRWEWTLDASWSCGLAGAFFPDIRAEKSSPSAVSLADVQVGRDFLDAFVRYRH